MPRSEATAAYLRRVGVEGELPPTYDNLVALHRAHLDAVPYENLAIMLGTVLCELGFEISRRHGHVYTADEDRDRAELNHLVLVADGLPTDDNPGGRWWVDVGLGDAFRDPVAVTRGRHDQGGFHYEITEVRDDGWSFRHDRAGTFTGVDTVRGCLWHRTLAEHATETELTSYDAWRQALADGTRLSLEGVDDGELGALYAAQWAKHLAWTAAGRP